MNSMTLILSDVDGLDFGAGLISYDEFRESICDDTVCFGPFDAAPDYLFGPLHNSFLREETITCELEGSDVEVAVSEIPVFNTNKEIKESPFFTSAQAEFVIKKVKECVAQYYKAWSCGYRSDEDFIEVYETGTGGISADLDFDGPFDKANLFFIQADKLYEKDDSIIAVVGYKNPDGSISYSCFEKGNYNSDEAIIHYDSVSQSWEDWVERFCAA